MEGRSVGSTPRWARSRRRSGPRTKSPPSCRGSWPLEERGRQPRSSSRRKRTITPGRSMAPQEVLPRSRAW